MKRIFTTLFPCLFILQLLNAQQPFGLSKFGSRNVDGFLTGYSYAMAVQHDGKVLILTEVGQSNDAYDLAVFRYNPDASPDTTLGVYVRYTGEQFHGTFGGVIYEEQGPDNFLAVQNDNKFLVASGGQITRFNSNGTVDSSFGNNGKVTSFTGINDIVTLGNGKILVANNDAVTQILSDGSIDQSFGTNGSILTTGASGVRIVLVVQPDGKIIVGKSSGLTRYLPDGKLDNAFVSRPYPAGLSRFSSLSLSPDNKIVVGGSAYNGTNSDFAAVRFNADGTLDSAFGTKGLASVDFNGGDDIGQFVGTQVDGKIIVGGHAFIPRCATCIGDAYGLARFNADGTLDLSFGTGGKITSGENLAVTGMQLWQDRIYLSGYTYPFKYPGNSVNITGIQNNANAYDPTTAATTSCNLLASINESYEHFGPFIFTASPSSGQAPYSYLWSTGETTQTITDLPAVPNPFHIEAEDFWGYTQGIQTEPTTDVGGGRDVGYIEPGYVLDYNFELPVTGLYTVKFRVATPANNASFDITDDYDHVFASVKIPNTGGYQKWVTISTTVQLNAGKQIFRLHNTSPPNNHWNINWLELIRPVIKPLVHMETENYTTMNGVVNEPTTDEGGGQDVGYIDPGDYMNYTVTVPVGGLYTMKFRLASIVSAATFNVVTGNGSYIKTIYVPNTGGYQNWTTVKADVILNAGTQTIQLISTSPPYNNWNINWFEVVGAPKLIHAQIQAEDYVAMSGVVKEPTTDVGGGQDVGYIDPGDWMDYNVAVPAAGSYAMTFRVACLGNCSFNVLAPGGQVLAAVQVPNTGGYQSWTNVTQTIPLQSGSQTLRLISTSQPYNNWNINWFDVLGTGPSDSNMYTVLVTDANGCQAFASINFLSVFHGDVPQDYLQGTQKLRDKVVETDSSFKLQAYPNPSAADFHLQMTAPDATATGKLIIYNQLGTVVEQLDLGPNTTITIGAGYNSGIYIAKLIQGNKQTTLRLVKLH